MPRFRNSSSRFFLHNVLLSIVVSLYSVVQLSAIDAPDSSTVNIPTVVRLIRVYGGSNERLPPVLLVNQRSADIMPAFGERSLSIEMDIQANVPPAFTVSFVHCRADWTEDNNVFLNDIAYMHSTNISWQAAPPSSRYYTYRGTMTIPNESVKIPYGGNWKVRVTEIGNDTTVFAEGRFFAVDAAASCTLDVFGDFYEPRKRVSPIALSLEASVTANLLMSDLQLQTAVFYRLNRWYEPIVATSAPSLAPSSRSRFAIQGSVAGLSAAGKRFRISALPAENDYRVLDMSNVAQFPRSTVPIRFGLTDLRRNGSILIRGDDAAMITSDISGYDDEYVPVEFVLDPENRPSEEDVFVVGSFNGWRPTSEWQMQYVESERLYKLRHWIRRARHNYAYATGRVHADTREVENLSYEEFEGNNATAAHTFVCFVYYRDQNFGGYDSIVGVAAASIYGPVRR